MSHTVLPGPEKAENGEAKIGSALESEPPRESSSFYHCVRCNGGLERQEQDGLRCNVCRAFYPSIEGVEVFVSNPDPLLRNHVEFLPEKRKEIEAQRVKVRDAYDEELHAPESLAVMERDFEGQLANLELIEQVMESATQYVNGRSQPKSFFDDLAGGGWPALEMLPYFYRDWGGTKEAEELNRLFTGDIERFCRERESVAVLGCGACGLVYQVAELFPVTFGVELAIDTLLLAKRLLDGGDFTLHYSAPKSNFPISQKVVKVEGAGRKREGINLLVANVNQLPFRSSSLSCVITQYLMDIVPSQRRVVTEINRVLAPGGVWLDFSLPLSMSAADQFNRLNMPQFFQRFGFKLLDQSMHRFTHLDMTPLSEWAWSFTQTPVSCAVEKVSLPVKARPNYFAEYFAGTSDAVWDKIPRRVVDVSLVHERQFRGDGVRESKGLAVLHLNDPRPAKLGVRNETAVLIEWFLRTMDGVRTVREIFDLMREDYADFIQPDEVLNFFNSLEEASYIEID
ncbi:MAG: methyltransferase domain-containing protein [Pyrinomonadaceae bacterium]